MDMSVDYESYFLYMIVWDDLIYSRWLSLSETCYIMSLRDTNDSDSEMSTCLGTAQLRHIRDIASTFSKRKKYAISRKVISWSPFCLVSASIGNRLSFGPDIEAVRVLKSVKRRKSESPSIISSTAFLSSLRCFWAPFFPFHSSSPPFSSIMLLEFLKLHQAISSVWSFSLLSRDFETTYNDKLWSEFLMWKSIKKYNP